MPFDFSRLTTAQQQRLYDLSTPIEAQVGQIAAGSRLADEVRIQPAYPPMSRVRMNGDDATFVVGDLETLGQTIVDAEERAIVEPLDIRFYNTTAAVFENPMFAYFNFQSCTQLAIFHEHIPIELLQALAPKMPNVEVVKLENLQNIIRLTEILPLFPKLKKLFIPYIYQGWVRDLLDLNATDFNLQGSLRSGCRFEDVFSFQKRDLRKLIEKGCTFIMHLENSNAVAIETQMYRIVQFMMPTFKHDIRNSEENPSPFHVALDRPHNPPMSPTSGNSAMMAANSTWLFFHIKKPWYYCSDKCCIV